MGGGKSEFDIPACAHDALTYQFLARREMGQGRVPPAEKVFFGSGYDVRLQYTGAMDIKVGGKTETTDHVNVFIKGPGQRCHRRGLLRARCRAHAAAVQSPGKSRHPFPGAGAPLMRVAFFSPLPPARSGIADYSEALIRAMKPLVELEVFSGAHQPFDPARFDIALYHVGNNGYHGYVYETALRHPGVVVMHESNLHHLIADLTIKRGDWDGYVRECEYDGGPAALEFAGRVRRLEVGPDYEGVPMTRRILESARGVVVHSRFMQEEMRAAKFSGPCAVHPARRMDSRGGPQRLPPQARPRRVDPAGGHLRISQAL